MHEIGHALGLWHEQTRPDREETIDIIWENIVESYTSQFNTEYDVDNLGLPYDLGSVMQYASLVSGRVLNEGVRTLDQGVVGLAQILVIYPIRMIWVILS